MKNKNKWDYLKLEINDYLDDVRCHKKNADTEEKPIYNAEINAYENVLRIMKKLEKEYN